MAPELTVLIERQGRYQTEERRQVTEPEEDCGDQDHQQPNPARGANGQLHPYPVTPPNRRTLAA